MDMPLWEEKSDTTTKAEAEQHQCPFMKFYAKLNALLPSLMKLDLSHGISGIDLSQTDIAPKVASTTADGKPNVLSLYTKDNDQRCPLMEALDGEYEGNCPFLQCLSKMSTAHAKAKMTGSDGKQLKEWKDKAKWLFPKTVPDLDLEAFSGVYFLTHASALPLGTYLKDKFCSTANYGAPQGKSLLGIFKDVSTFSIDYRGNTGSPSGEGADESGMKATAWQFSDKRAPAKLVTTSDESLLQIDQMRIIRLGPLDSDGKYEFAVVTDMTGVMLHVLARKPKRFREKYAEALIENLRASGWDDALVEPLPTYQGRDCTYPQYVYDAFPAWKKLE